MTRPLLTLASLAVLLLAFAAAAAAPVNLAGATLPAARAARAADGRSPFDLRLGDGIFQLRIRGCAVCATAITIEIHLRGLLGRAPPAAVNLSTPFTYEP